MAEYNLAIVYLRGWVSGDECIIIVYMLIISVAFLFKVEACTLLNIKADLYYLASMHMESGLFRKVCNNYCDDYNNHYNFCRLMLLLLLTSFSKT